MCITLFGLLLFCSMIAKFWTSYKIEFWSVRHMLFEPNFILCFVCLVHIFYPIRNFAMKCVEKKLCLTSYCSVYGANYMIQNQNWLKWVITQTIFYDYWDTDDKPDSLHGGWTGVWKNGYGIWNCNYDGENFMSKIKQILGSL